MANEMTMASPGLVARPSWLKDASWALAVALATLAVAAATGFPSLADSGGDNDSLLRLVEVRDLIAGQGWFDLHQYRMGVDGAMPMHWSRLVDLPLAAIILLITTLTGSQAIGETGAMILWPMTLYACALFLLLRIGRQVGDEAAAVPLLVIGGVSLYYTGMFAPGVIDHHNAQLVLALALIHCLLKASPEDRAAWWAGLLAVLMLAIGMETLPFVAVAGIAVSTQFLVGGEGARSTAFSFGASFALASAAVFVATVPPSNWREVHCDAFSVAHFGIGILAGGGLSAIAAAKAVDSIGRKTLALAALASLTASAALLFAPQCLADPYAGLAPALKVYWLDFVGEAQPLWNVLVEEPEAAGGHYLTALTALLVFAARIQRNGLRRQDAIFGAFLLMAFLVSVWQIRGSRFSIPLACVPLAMWVADWRARAQAAPGAGNTLKMLGAWIASFNVTWILLGATISLLISPDQLEAEAARERCQKAEDYDDLAKMTPQGVLVISNLGAPVLRYTPHHVLAGPYHRNVEGNLAAIDAFNKPDAARDIAVRHGLTLLAFCPGNPETAFFAERSPEGLLAALARGEAPAWLESYPESSAQPLRLYRVVPSQ